MLTEHPNSLLLHHCLQAANTGDRGTLRALWADDIVWHIKGAGRWQGELKGPDEIFEYLADLGEVGTLGVHTEVEDVMVSPQRAAALCQSTTELGERALEVGYLVVATIVDRKIQSMITVHFDEDRLADFFEADCA